ncbi:hypothetical protein JNW91_27905, partial [Micromonospora sp. STR1_7]|nr:hypothetical protein [Micromonospora parastrephiae]
VVLGTAGLAALLGAGALLAQNLDSPEPPARSPGPSPSHTPAPAPSTRSPKPAPPTTPPAASSPVPSAVGQQVPVSLRQVTNEFAAVLAEAQDRGEIDRQTAEDLRDDLADVNRRSRDRAKHVGDLREHIAELVDRHRLSARTAPNSTNCSAGPPPSPPAVRTTDPSAGLTGMMGRCGHG